MSKYSYLICTSSWDYLMHIAGRPAMMPLSWLCITTVFSHSDDLISFCLMVHMLVFFFCSHPTPDMPFLLIYIQHLSGILCQCRIDLLQPFRDILMCSRYYLERFCFPLYLCSQLLQQAPFHPIPTLQLGARKYQHYPHYPLLFY